VPPQAYWSESYFQYDESYFAREIAIAKQMLDFRPGMTSLDVGAGIGKGMESLSAVILR
jgi:ubiquinone/menaquinone biosynthesis C-methylase UbiE